MTGIAFAADAAPAAGPGGLGAFLPLILIFAVFGIFQSVFIPGFAQKISPDLGIIILTGQAT